MDWKTVPTEPTPEMMAAAPPWLSLLQLQPTWDRPTRRR